MILVEIIGLMMLVYLSRLISMLVSVLCSGLMFGLGLVLGLNCLEGMMLLIVLSWVLVMSIWFTVSSMMGSVMFGLVLLVIVVVVLR